MTIGPLVLSEFLWLCRVLARIVSPHIDIISLIVLLIVTSYMVLSPIVAKLFIFIHLESCQLVTASKIQKKICARRIGHLEMK